MKGNIIDLVNHPLRLSHIGRLDKESEGLILLTNDGDIINEILRPENKHEKEYIVSVDKPITAEFVKNMSEGVRILDTKTLPCEVEQLSKFEFKIILTQGLNRQIRRMCAELGYEVVRLVRTRIMNIHLGNLPMGQWRDLTKKKSVRCLRSWIMSRVNGRVRPNRPMSQWGGFFCWLGLRKLCQLEGEWSVCGFISRNERLSAGLSVYQPK